MFLQDAYQIRAYALNYIGNAIYFIFLIKLILEPRRHKKKPDSSVIFWCTDSQFTILSWLLMVLIKDYCKRSPKQAIISYDWKQKLFLVKILCLLVFALVVQGCAGSDGSVKGNIRRKPISVCAGSRFGHTITTTSVAKAIKLTTQWQMIAWPNANRPKKLILLN